MFEIEMKARIPLKDDEREPHELLKALRKRFGDGKSFFKSDVYYISPITGERFRMRKTGGKTILTVKHKEQIGIFEQNEEFEAELLGDDFIPVFCEKMGLQEVLRKEKKGYAFGFREAEAEYVLELCQVSSLGWFLEIECLVSQDEKAEFYRTRVQRLFEDFNISESQFEPRYYMDLLQSKDI
jgi:predicted adenylyl cyclase CyaB